MICFPNAKINLGLNVVSKREDGYHNLETIFYPILIQDALELIVKEDQKEDRLLIEGIKIEGSSEDNLVMKALQLMRKHYTFPTVDIHLLKKIPFGAGIGGGSADAAFMLKLLNDTFSLNTTNEELITLATQLGADCPFFIYNKPMYAEGIGEKLEDINFTLNGYTLVLVKPDIHVSTKDAFATIEPIYPTISVKEIIQKPIEKWKDLLVNDFEKSVFEKFPEIEKIKERLYAEGAIYVSMTGSGSSVFGIFQDDFLELADMFKDCYTWFGKLN